MRLSGTGGDGDGGALPNRTGGGGRPGENVSDITVLVAKMAAENGAAFPCRSVGGAEFTLHVQESYQPKPPETELAPFIVAHAAVLYDLLRTVTRRVLQLPDSMPIRLVYMTTIRADTAVAGKGSDGALYFNVMAFQQAGCCGGGAEATPSAVDPAQFYRVLRYWTQRAAIASELPPPTGLYDGAVWTRMHAVFDEAVAAGAARPEHADDG